MINRQMFLYWMGSVALCAACLPGCKPKAPVNSDAGPPGVSVSQPIQRDVTDYVEFVGRTESPNSIEIRARVTGYLMGMPFREGDTVKAGDLLFQIDDRPYKAELDQAAASLEEAKAAAVKSQAFLDIGLETQKLSPGAVSQQEIVQRQGARDEANAAVKSAQASLERCQLNYDWCKVTSPIAGRVSRYYLTLGNLATQDTAVLTTIVSEDPLYVYFDIDERTALRIIRSLLPGEVDRIKNKQVPVLMGLSDEQDFPHTGYIDFANNVVNPSTGTVTVRGVFDNPLGTSGRRLLKPGMFVRVRLPIGKPYPALLVSEKALATDQGQKCVYVVDAKNQVEYRRVKVGPVQSDGLRVIEEGVKAGEWVLVSGLQLVRPRLEVKPEQVPMGVTPDSSGAAQAVTPDSSGGPPAASRTPGNPGATSKTPDKSGATPGAAERPS